jgi:hypothetical protein
MQRYYLDERKIDAEKGSDAKDEKKARKLSTKIQLPKKEVVVNKYIAQSSVDNKSIIV